MPNQTWQSDFTHYRLTDPTTFPGRASRSSPGSTTAPATPCTSSAHRRSPPRSCTATFRETAGQHGIPASTLTDNGMVYTVRLAGIGHRGGRNGFEQQLRDWHVVQKNSRPNHPTTCGKVERFQQTMKKWLRAQPVQPATIADLQSPARPVPHEYNHHRPHRSLPHRATPAALYDTMPKALPGPSRDADTHDRIRTTRRQSPAPSPCASPANSATSASAEPTPEPTSSCSSRTSTYASSTPPPASSSANSPSTPPSDYQPPDPNEQDPNPLGL